MGDTHRSEPGDARAEANTTSSPPPQDADAAPLVADDNVGISLSLDAGGPSGGVGRCIYMLT